MEGPVDHNRDLTEAIENPTRPDLGSLRLEMWKRMCQCWISTFIWPGWRLRTEECGVASLGGYIQLRLA